MRKCGSLRVFLVWSAVVTSVGVVFVLVILPHCTSIEPTPFFHLSTPSARTPKTLVSYAYFERSHEYIDRLRFFLETAALPSSTVDYIFVVQGSTTVTFPDQSNIHVFHRENSCFDFGAHGKGLQHMRERLQFEGDLAQMYDFYIFLNPSAIGPLLPSYWPADRTWTSIFTSRITDQVKLVGPSLVCLPPEDLGGYGPKVRRDEIFLGVFSVIKDFLGSFYQMQIEGYVFATDSMGLSLLWNSNNFKCHADKVMIFIKNISHSLSFSLSPSLS